MFALADVGVLAIRCWRGWGQWRGDRTTNLNINFLRMPGSVDLVADGRILKLGRRLAIGECAICCRRRAASWLRTRPRPARSRPVR